MKKTLEYLVKGFIYLTFFVPLVVIPSSFIFPFIVPKILLLRSFILLALAGYFLLLIINWREYRPKLTPLNVILGLFLLSFTISTFVGVDPYHSFWDNHERMLGLFTIFHYVALYFLCGSLFKNWVEWKTALKIFLIAGSLVMILGLVQVQDRTFLLNQVVTRIASTLGNPIYVGGYGLFLSFLAFLLFMKEESKWWRVAEALMGILALLGMFFSDTRGSMLGFLAGIGVAVVGYSVVLVNYPRTRKILWGVAVFGVAAISFLYIYRDAGFVRGIPTIGRTLNTSLSDLKASPRWVAWEIAINSWKERPVFGWGPNNFFYAFNLHYNPKSLEFGYGETWFDNAHNIIVNTLAVQGAAGIVIYLAIFIGGIFVLWRKKEMRYANPHLVVIGSAFLVAHLVQNVTVFENPTSYLYFMVWLAMVNRLTMKNKQQTISNLKESPKKQFSDGVINPDKRIGVGLISTVAVLFLVLIFIFNIQPSRANKQTLNALRQMGSNPMLGAAEMKKALEFNSPHIDDIRSDIARSAVAIISTQDNRDKLGKERSNEIFEVAYSNLQKNLVIHPLDIRVHLALSQLAQVGAQMNNNFRYILEAEKFLEDALKASPRRQQIIYSLSMLKMQAGKNDEATRLVEQAIEDNPKIEESYWRLAYIYKILNQLDKAKEVVRLAEKNNIIFSEQGAGIVAGIMMSTSTSNGTAGN